MWPAVLGAAWLGGVGGYFLGHRLGWKRGLAGAPALESIVAGRIIGALREEEGES